MIRKKSRIMRQWIIFRSAFGTAGELVQGVWQSPSRRRWMIPLILFLCLNGLILTLAAGVEALAPFVYSIF
ncbi:DUF5989 family protein [Sphingobium sp. EM0848]|uniref:DUF5989 family protein n=1 Tax=Sphingobium sp. EM0848 TaxID=2743473 RepID=UPI00159C4FD2|nr:DUF5989 family protein [Sphingobium sp. EM0848]